MSVENQSQDKRKIQYKQRMQIPPLYGIDNGGCDARLAVDNQVASWTWRDRGTRAKPFWALAKTPVDSPEACCT